MSNRKTSNSSDKKVATFDALRLAVQYRKNTGQLPILAAISGVPVRDLTTFANTGKIIPRHRETLEVLI